MDLDENNLVDWDKLFALKRELKNKKKSEIKFCNGCRAIEYDFDFDKEDDYIAFINFNHWNRCNSNCIYCCSEYNGGDKYFNVFPLIKSLAEYKDGTYLRGIGEFTFQGGEPTLLPEFEDLLNLLLLYKNRMRIHSSGIKYSDAIETGIKENLLTVVISPDSAIKETYERIKRVKAFDIVWENLRKYAAAQKTANNVKAKYIIIPGINDSIQEIDTFLNKIQEINIKHVIWDIESRFCVENSYEVPNVAMLLDYAVYQSKKRNIQYEFYDSAIYVEKKKKEFDTVFDEKFKERYKITQEKYSFNNVKYNNQNTIR